MCTYSIVARVVRVAVCNLTHILCIASECYYVKTESSQANEGLPQSYLRAKSKEAAAGNENRACLDFFVKLRWEARELSMLYSVC